jgi:hypothetical protein
MKRSVNRLVAWGRRVRRSGAACMATVAAWGVVTLTLAAPAFAQVPQVQYGTANSAAQAISTQLENVAATIRDILGATALVAILIGAMLLHGAHDVHLQDTSKRVIAAAILALALAAFAPTIINWIGSLGTS